MEGQIAAALPGPRVADVSESASLATIQRELLGSGESQLVEYFLGEHGSVVWVIGRDSVTLERLPARPVIERLARKASALMAESHDRHKRVRARLAAEALAAMVVEPIARSLTAPRLVIVPDGALAGVSFAALPLEATADAPLLIDRFEITRLPSASVGVALGRRGASPAPAGRLAVVADPVFDRHDPRVRGGSDGSAARPRSAAPAAAAVTRAMGTGELARLEATAREAQAIASFTEPDQRRLLLGFDAERRRVLDGALCGYRVVHFATHGLVLGRLSGLVMSQVDRRGRPVDGFLRSWEVYDLGLRADLVVLSACRTGLGHRLPGEGVMGLSRAFLASGASQVLVSLWDVGDRATAGLMERFYRGYLAQGLPPATALREAQRWVRAQPEWSAPTIGPASCSRACRAETLRAARPSAGVTRHGTGRV